MASEYPTLHELALWPHQERAVETIKSYIQQHRHDLTTKSALVQMPTGSGKSGVIAVLARCIPEVGLTVVLTPRTALRKQLFDDIDGGFFRKIQYPVDNLPKAVKEVTESIELRLEKLPNDQVFVMTIQMLESLAERHSDVFTRLVNETSLLIVDEGQYEPAFDWSKTIRQIKAPKVIFTATPYRNDLKVFDIDLQHSFTLALCKATDDNFLRSVQFVPRAHTTDPGRFVDDVIDFYDHTFPTPGEEPPRVIIRCDEGASIRHLAQELEKRGRSVVGIHETFSSDEPWARKEVPSPKSEPAVFWIHQFKLLEGIDDSRFQVVALFQKLPTARALVQQVGRIIRNPDRLSGAKGYVLDHWNGFHRELWDGFISYDRMIDQCGPNVFELATGAGMLDKMIQLQPSVGYVEGRFRTKFNLDTIDVHRDIQLPLRANVMEKLVNFDLNHAAAFLVEHYQEADRIVRQYSPSNVTQVILSIRCSSSPYLRSHSFMEADLHVTVLHEISKYIFSFDSSGSVPFDERKLNLRPALDAHVLKKLFRPGTDGRLTSVALNNSNLGTSSIRSRTMTASSIEATVPGFNDYAHICTTAEGYSNDDAGTIHGAGLARRYVGFSRGRITQPTSGLVPLPDYLGWLDRIGRMLDSDDPTLPVLDRYALEVEAPEKAEARSILLDMEDAQESYDPIDAPDEAMMIEDACCEVKNGAFTIKANGRLVDARIRNDNGRYLIESPGLDALYVKKEGDASPSSVVKYLNTAQSFRVLPEDLTRVYVRGQYYRPAMKVGAAFSRDTYALRSCFVTDQTIGLCASEKGSAEYYKKRDDDWDPSSLFGIISRCGVNTSVAHHFGKPDIMVCDDIGTEIADFVLCERDKPRVVFIHAKASAVRHDCSTSGLHEVCAQAVKNLGYLAMFNDQRPSKLVGSWSQSWNVTMGDKQNRVKAKVLKRIRMGSGTPEQLWDQLRAAVNDPIVEKEVWLFTGNLISKQEFERELERESPAAHVVQAAYLLHGTMSDVAAVGAKLRVFCAR